VVPVDICKKMPKCLKQMCQVVTKQLRGLTGPMPPDIDRLAVPALVRAGVARCGGALYSPGSLAAPSSRKLASLAMQRAPCLPNPLSMAVKASSMSPAVPGRRFGAAAPGPRRAAVISGPTGGRRCLRYGTLLKRGFCVCSSWRASRSGSFNGTPRPGVARELLFKNHFKGEAIFFE
jgi:hypothetical protein